MTGAAATPPSSTTRTLVRTRALLDVRQGTALERASVLALGERIEAVIPGGAPEPAHDRLIDLSTLTVAPGLIDCHVHLIGDLSSTGVGPGDEQPELELLHGVRNAHTTLAAGFTAVRDVGTVRAGHDLKLRAGIEAGLVPGPRMFCAGAYVTAAGGGADPDAESTAAPAAGRLGVVRTIGDVRATVDALADLGAAVIKLVVTGGGVIRRYTDPDLLELEPALVSAAVEEASARGLGVAAAAHGATGIALAARSGVRSVEHGTYADEAAMAALADEGTYLIVDLYSGPWVAERGRAGGWAADVLDRNNRIIAAKEHTFRLALERGVRLAFGTDAVVYPHGENARQFPYMLAAGMTPWQALQSATAVAADLLGSDSGVGYAEPGRFADLVGYEGDPLADVSLYERPAAVVKGGVLSASR